MATYTLYTDGSYTAITDTAGIGGLLLDEDNHMVWKFSQKINEYLENHEIQALHYGLTKCMASGIKKVICKSDSKSLIEVLRGEANFKSEYSLQMAGAIKDMAMHFESIDFLYIPRQENTLSDQLSREYKKVLKIREAFAPPLHAHAQITSKEHFSSRRVYEKTRTDIEHVYVFAWNEDWTCLNIHYGHKGSEITTEHLKTVDLNLSMTKEFLEEIKEVLKTSPYDKISLSLPAKGEIMSLMKGVRPVPKKLKEIFKDIYALLDSKSTVHIEDQGKVYNHIYPSVVKTMPHNKENKHDFIISAIKKLGDDYVLGSAPEIEGYFELPQAKKENVDEIQKKYFGEIIKMMRKEGNNIPYQEVKDNLENQGIKFKF